MNNPFGVVAVRPLIALVFGVVLLVGSDKAPAENQTASTDPAGIVRITVRAGSDFRYAAPLTNSAVLAGEVDAIAGNVITVKQAGAQPTPVANSFVYQDGTQNRHFYLLIASGTKEGMFAPITANAGNTVTVGLGSGGLTGVQAGDRLRILPHWTLRTLFPSVPDGTEVLVFNGDSVGVNIAASISYTYYDGFGWYDGGTPADDVPIEPDESVIIRNNSSSDFDMVLTGNVPATQHYAIVSTLAPNQDQDNPIGYSSPIPVEIGKVGLGFDDGDQLLVFDNDAIGLNKAATISLTFYADYGWYDGGTNVDDSFKLLPGAGYVFRKASTPQTQTLLWQNRQPYLPFQ